MSARAVLVGALLGVAVGVVLLACFGLVRARGAYDGLHLLSLASIWGPLIVFVAVVVAWPGAGAVVNAGLVALVSLVSGPVLTHATARAVLVRGAGKEPG